MKWECASFRVNCFGPLGPRPRAVPGWPGSSMGTGEQGKGREPVYWSFLLSPVFPLVSTLKVASPVVLLCAVFSKCLITMTVMHNKEASVGVW